MKRAFENENAVSLSKVLQLLTLIESGEFDDGHDFKDDQGWLALISEKLNSVIRISQAKAQAKANERIESLLVFVTKLAALEFGEHMELSGDDAFDGLVAGLNMLSEELEHSVISKSAIEQKNKLIEAIVENIPSAIFLKDAQDGFRITLWNKAAEKIFDLPRESVLEKTTHDNWPKDLADLYHATDVAICTAGIKVDIAEEPSVSKSIGQIWLHTQKIPLRIRTDGKTDYLLGICDDITEKREALQKLIATSKMSSLGEMAGGIAHEINNPLAIIQGKANLLLRRIRKEKIDLKLMTEDIEKISFTTERIAKIIRGLVAFSRNAENDLVVSENLVSLIENVKSLCIERFRTNKVKLDIYVESGLAVDCRGVQIEQVLVNLLNNAFDAVMILDEKWIRLEVSSMGTIAKILVTDSGKGIPSKLVEKLMQPFFTTKEIGKGTGLGLSISKGIIEKHQGRLYYQASCPNTQFVIELPLKQIKNELLME